MFIYNLKLNKKTISKLFIAIALLIIVLIIAFSVYTIFFKHSSNTNNNNNIIDLNETNYTNILKASNENIDAYVGKKVRITGYVYRLLDFDDNQFVIARDMRFDENSPAIVVGFLANYNKISEIPDGTWVEVEGEIGKGNFNGDIAMLNVTSIKQCDKPENIFVNPPDNTYIPTSNMF